MEIIKLMVLLAVMLGFVVFGISFFIEARNECEQKGGALVKGVIGVACVRGVGK